MTIDGKKVVITDDPITPENVVAEAKKLLTAKIDEAGEQALIAAAKEGKITTQGQLAQIMAMAGADYVSIPKVFYPKGAIWQALVRREGQHDFSAGADAVETGICLGG